MGLNILAELDQLIKDGIQFRGAVFLTYSLNLQFFEQLLQPKLEALGCVNVVIISDQFGYQEALTHNLQRIRGAGRQYVCVPVSAHGRGVQHSKVLMLLSEQRGWMLIGSGNLTFSGYGQNLELFDCFAFDGLSIQGAYPFQTIWQMIERLKPTLSQIAQNQLSLLSKDAPWLTTSPQSPSDIELWHSFDRSLADRLFALDPVHELQLIAPFIDRSAVEKLLRHFSPTKLVIGVDDDRRHIDGPAIEKLCQMLGCTLEVYGLRAKTQEAAPYRGLHAKAIIGINEDQSWCFVGSANITRPALLDYWLHQGNLEVAVFRKSSDTRAFDALWASDVSARRLPAAGLVSVIEQTSSQSYHIRLVNPTLQDRVLRGSVIFDASLAVQEIQLDLVLSGQSYRIPVDQAENFSLVTSVSGIEVAIATVICQDGTQLASSRVFIDYPAELSRYRARSFHRSIRSKLESVSNAAYMFHELMEFLLQRTHPNTLTHETITQQRRTERHQTPSTQSAETEGEVLPISAFITQEELNHRLGQRVDTLHPYDRDHYSLRDLLSLALLRLTTETGSSKTQQLTIEEAAMDEAIINLELEEQRNRQYDSQKRLTQYLITYCKRYAQSLQNADFVSTTGSQLLFQNHHTLARVLIEFRDKVEPFTASHMRQMIRLIWEPVFRPQGVRDTLQCAKDKEIWEEEKLTEVFVTMMVLAWDQPSFTIDNTAEVQRFLYARHLIRQAEASGCLGKAFWKTLAVEDEPLSAEDEEQSRLGIKPLTPTMVRHFSMLARYKTPIEQRYDLCFKLMRLRKSRKGQSDEARALEQDLRGKHPEDWKLAERAIDILPVVGSERNCPVRNIELPDSVLARLRNGGLALSEHPRGGMVLLYWMPALNEQNVIL